MKSKHLYGFGDYGLDALERVLLRDGQPVTLPPKDLETLLVLVERAGHIVEKGELLEKYGRAFSSRRAIWPGTSSTCGTYWVMARTDANTSKRFRSEAIASLLR